MLIGLSIAFVVIVSVDFLFLLLQKKKEEKNYLLQKRKDKEERDKAHKLKMELFFIRKCLHDNHWMS